ncbi:hypothetical protein [Novosphingobium sp. AAP83]|uniref:hypothetical protein n=1 Tax=Novosphingobium sp. AAP83 TaxID=1523425 RepID=UPI000AFB23A1|nr:hypothetical protein [Novosphingobium sp. AAP83]
MALDFAGFCPFSLLIAPKESQTHVAAFGGGKVGATTDDSKNAKAEICFVYRSRFFAHP